MHGIYRISVRGGLGCFNVSGYQNLSMLLCLRGARLVMLGAGLVFFVLLFRLWGGDGLGLGGGIRLLNRLLKQAQESKTKTGRASSTPK